MVEYQDTLNEFTGELIDLIEKYKDSLPSYEVVNVLICNGTSMSLSCAPNELEGAKTVMICVEKGMSEYEQTHS